MTAGRRNRGQAPISRSGQKGFTYLALMITVAVGGAVLASIGELTSHAMQRDKEADLLFVGQQYRQAIAAYYERSPGGAKRFPQKLDDLLQDKRYPNVQRYLRRPYPDPITGKTDWGLVEAPGGGIMGVYSLSDAPPVKNGGFFKRDESFNDALRYADWKFFYAAPTPPAVASASAPGPNGLDASRPRNTEM
jgi:type II secretory pathway pseudopilin PulG